MTENIFMLFWLVYFRFFHKVKIGAVSNLSQERLTSNYIVFYNQFALFYYQFSSFYNKSGGFLLFCIDNSVINKQPASFVVNTSNWILETEDYKK